MIEQIILLVLIVFMVAGSYLKFSDITELYNKMKTEVMRIISYIPKGFITTIFLLLGILTLAIITSLSV